MMTFLAGIMISGGFLAITPSFLLLMIGEIVPDSGLYLIGKSATKNGFINRWINRTEMVRSRLYVFDTLWKEHTFKTMFLGKFSWGFAIPIVITSGISKLPYKRFLLNATTVTIIKYTILMLAGFLVGKWYGLSSSHYFMKYVSYVFIFIFLVAYVLFSRYTKRKLEASEKIPFEKKD